MDVADESLAELFEQYKDEVRETIGTLDSELVAVEQDPANSEVIFSLFRHLHSLKGSSKMFNVDNLGHIAHKLEDLMQIIDRDNSILARFPKIVDLLFRGNDIFRGIIARLEEDISYVNLTPEHAQFIEEINRQLDQISSKETGLVEAAKIVLAEIEALLPVLEELDTEALRRAVSGLSGQVSLLTLDKGSGQIRYKYAGVDLTAKVIAFEAGLEKFKSGRFDSADVEAFFQNAEAMSNALFDVAEEGIMDVIAELNDGLAMYREKNLEIDQIVIEFLSTIFKDLLERFQAEAAAKPPEIVLVEERGPATGQPVEPSRAPAPTQTKTIRVDEKKIDQFLESVGKLITQSEILNHLQFSFREAGINPALVRNFASVNRTISNDIIALQRSIMEVRQVEMDNILKKFPRLVRDISHKMGKEIELVIEGERVPIDKSLLDDVEQAMIHLVRNAIDHGLETPEERVIAGKSRRCRLAVRVIQVEASILVEMSDDGRGIDFGAVKRKALERGLINREESEALSDQEAEWLLFKSGVTTKTEATDISGRGVGLDVVMSNIKKWNGDVLLNNRPGQGLTVSLRIPITNTLLTKEAILLKLGPTMFCLPLDYIVEIIIVPAGQVHRHQNQRLFKHRDQVIAVVDIKGLLNMSAPEDDSLDKTFIILRGKTSNRKAIAADEIVGQQKIVIKEFEMESFRRLPYYQGLTLLGDGRVVLILDAEKIVET
ncbi:MAG: chemotaxis protein CheA [Thermodesulfobacteriota bacterium]